MTTRSLQWEDVPAGSSSSTCRGKGCGALIFWVERPGKSKPGVPVKTVRVPVDCSVHGGRAPTADVNGKGINHFQSCPAANRF